MEVINTKEEVVDQKEGSGILLVENNKKKKAVGRQSKVCRIRLPWSGVVEEGRCKSVVWNGGLHTQCEGEGEEYCVECGERVKREGVNKMGSVYERLSKGLYEYKDGYGRRSVQYVKYMQKEGLSKEEVLSYASRVGSEILLEHFEERKISRGRPRKWRENEERKEVELGLEKGLELGLEKGLELGLEKEKKKRGRPRKEKEVCSNGRGDELIASLLECVEEEETKVIRFNIKGKEYLKSEDNVLYDNKTHEAVGIWNEENGVIEEIPNEDED